MWKGSVQLLFLALIISLSRGVNICIVDKCEKSLSELSTEEDMKAMKKDLINLTRPISKLLEYWDHLMFQKGKESEKSNRLHEQTLTNTVHHFPSDQFDSGKTFDILLHKNICVI